MTMPAGDNMQEASVRRQVAQDYGYGEEEIQSTIESLRASAVTSRVMDKILGDSELLGLCVYSLSLQTEGTPGFTIEERIEAVVVQHTSGKGGGKLGFTWTAMVEIPLLQAYGRATFTSDATFAIIRAALSEFLASSTPAPSSKSPLLSIFSAGPSSSSSAPSLIDDGSLVVSLLDGDGWSIEVTAGNFAVLASTVALQHKKSAALGLWRSSHLQQQQQQSLSDASVLTLTLRSSRDPFSARQRISELRLASRHNPRMRPRMALLEPMGYAGWRAVRGDGNCYYRAAMLGYFELALTSGPMSERAVALLKGVASRVETVYGPDPACAHGLLLEAVQRAATPETPADTLGTTAVPSSPEPRGWAALEAALLRDAELDLALVRAARALVGAQLEAQESASYNGLTVRDSILALWADVRSVSDYCAKYVHPLGVDAEGTLADLGLLFRALGVRGVTVLADASEPASGAAESKGNGEGAGGEDVSNGAAQLRVYESGTVAADDDTHGVAPSGQSQSQLLPWAWVSALFSGDIEGAGVGMDVPAGTTVNAAQRGAIHLLLRAGRGMGEGHYDLLYPGPTHGSGSCVEESPLPAHFRRQGQLRSFFSRLPVPPLLVPNHVHSVTPPSGRFATISADEPGKAPACAPASASDIDAYTPPGSSSAPSLYSSSDSSDSSDSWDEQGWEVVGGGKDGAPRSTGSGTNAGSGGATAANGGAKNSGPRRRLLLRLLPLGQHPERKEEMVVGGDGVQRGAIRCICQ